MRRTGHRQAVLVGVEPAQRRAEHLGHTVAGVGARHHRVVQEVLTLVEAHRVIGAREDDVLYTLAAQPHRRCSSRLC
jgi:hypothetical protein